MIECREIPIPEVEPGWLLLKTRYACICGSDLEYLDGSFEYAFKTMGGSGAIHPGSIPGHEFVAEVVEVGEGVRGWSVGDRALPTGDPDPYRTAKKPQTGYENYKCMAEYFMSTPLGLIKAPEHVDDESAVFIEPLMTGNGAAARAGLRPGKSTVVIGAGKIGLMAALAAKVSGASPVIITDLVDSRLEKAREMGIEHTLNAAKDDVVAEVGRLTGGGADGVLICVRDGRVLDQAALMTKRDGNIVLAGFVAPGEVDPTVWTAKRLSLFGKLSGSIKDAYRMIAQKQIDPRPMISEIVSFDECQRAFDSVYSGENIGVLFKP
ncbi:MAG: zinc-binding dehydrogenase [Proteobacteria bacterium]|nr:zinc-binding dehydrogenase [Pseudomonadota bacterium]